MTAMEQMGKRAKEAAAVLAVAGRKKNDALLAIAQALLSHSEEILKENQKDLENGKNAGLTPSLLDRLALSQERIAAMAEGGAPGSGNAGPHRDGAFRRRAAQRLRNH